MRKKVLMVDMDEVIVEKGFLYLINKYLGTNYKDTDFTQFRMQEIMPPKQRLEFFKWFKNYNMYDFCSFVDRAKENLKLLNECYDILIATAYIFPEAPEISGKFLENKFNFLYDNLPFISPTNLAFINRKDLIRAYCKIDDGVKNLRYAENLFLFPAYHNRDLSEEILNPLGIEKVDGWDDISRRLLPK